MNQFSGLLRQSAVEARDYANNASDAHTFEASWLESLVHRLEYASSLNDEIAVESEIDAIAHSILDSGPSTSSFAPSFNQALDALQRWRKKLKKQ